jgi:2-polyprenyl-3-methyl-5-hydroxy-6-metoxy-1,4-benzoquinol methylase
MKKFAQRSYQTELLDETNIPKELLVQNLKELDYINRTLGGHRISLKGLTQLLTDKSKPYTIIDIGCGGGDALLHIAKWARKKGFNLNLIGVDFNQDAIAYAQTFCKSYTEISFVNNDYKIFLNNINQVDIIHTSLFCHHLDDVQLIDFLKLANKAARVGIVINDLQRHWFAYYSIKWLTRLFNGSTLVKNDAPLSVLRGFKKSELKIYLKKAAVSHYGIKWMWAFRFLILISKRTL